MYTNPTQKFTSRSGFIYLGANKAEVVGSPTSTGLHKTVCLIYTNFIFFFVKTTPKMNKLHAPQKLDLTFYIAIDNFQLSTS